MFYEWLAFRRPDKRTGRHLIGDYACHCFFKLFDLRGLFFLWPVFELRSALSSHAHTTFPRLPPVKASSKGRVQTPKSLCANNSPVAAEDRIFDSRQRSSTVSASTVVSVRNPTARKQPLAALFDISATDLSNPQALLAFHSASHRELSSCPKFDALHCIITATTSCMRLWKMNDVPDAIVLSSGPLHDRSGSFSAFGLTVKLITFANGWEKSISIFPSFSPVPNVEGLFAPEVGVCGRLLLPGEVMCDEARAGVEGGGAELVGEVKRRLGVPKRGVSETGDKGRRLSIAKSADVEGTL